MRTLRARLTDEKKKGKTWRKFSNVIELEEMKFLRFDYVAIERVVIRPNEKVLFQRSEEGVRGKMVKWRLKVARE